MTLVQKVIITELLCNNDHNVIRFEILVREEKLKKQKQKLS